MMKICKKRTNPFSQYSCKIATVDELEAKSELENMETRSRGARKKRAEHCLLRYSERKSRVRGNGDA